MWYCHSVDINQDMNESEKVLAIVMIWVFISDWLEGLWENIMGAAGYIS